MITKTLISVVTEGIYGEKNYIVIKKRVFIHFGTSYGSEPATDVHTLDLKEEIA